MKNLLAYLLHAGLVRLGRFVIWPVLRYLGPVYISWLWPFPKHKGVLIVANHISEADPVLIQYACPSLIRFMAKADLFTRPILGRLISWFRPFAVRQKSADLKAVRTAITLLNQGEVVLIFPEGKVNRHSQELLPFNEGVALIARKTGCTVIPCAITGSRDVWPNQSLKVGTRHPIHVTWGTPRSYEERSSGRDILEELRRDIQQLGQQ